MSDLGKDRLKVLARCTWHGISQPQPSPYLEAGTYPHLSPSLTFTSPGLCLALPGPTLPYLAWHVDDWVRFPTLPSVKQVTHLILLTWKRVLQPFGG